MKFKKYISFYNFYDSQKCVDDFLRNVKYRFETNHKKWFNIENTQNSVRSDLELLLNIRYWTTETQIVSILMFLYLML